MIYINMSYCILRNDFNAIFVYQKKLISRIENDYLKRLASANYDVTLYFCMCCLSPKPCENCVWSLCYIVFYNYAFTFSVRIVVLL